MACAEPQVEGKVRFPVIALEVAVMQLMEIRGGRNSYFSHYDERLKSDVPLSRCERGMLCIHNHMDWMRWYDPVKQDTAEINNMLNRVHRQSGPRTDVDVFVMEEVRSFVERWPMQ